MAMGQQSCVLARGSEGAGCGAQTRGKHVLLHSLKKYLVSTCSVPGTVVGVGQIRPLSSELALYRGWDD